MLLVPLLATLGPRKLFFCGKKSARLAIFWRFRAVLDRILNQLCYKSIKNQSLGRFFTVFGAILGSARSRFGVDFLCRFQIGDAYHFSVFFHTIFYVATQVDTSFENAKHVFRIVIYDVKLTFVRFTLEPLIFEFAKYDLKVQFKSNMKICVFWMKKTSPKRFLRESRDRFFAKASFFEFGGLEMVAKRSPGLPRTPLGAHLGALGGLLGWSSGALG